MTTWFRGAMLLLGVAFAWTVLSALVTVPRVSFVRPPSFVPEREIVTYYVRVPRHPENRLLIVTAVAEAMVVSEMRRTLNGSSQALWNVRWRLPAGTVALVATVYDSQHEVWRDWHRLIVYSHGP